MNIKRLLVVLLILPFAFSLADVQVSMVSGKVTVQKTGSSDKGKSVKPKYRIVSDETLVLEKNAKIVLRLADGRSVTLDQPGTYPIAELEKAPSAKKDLGAQIKQKAGKKQSKGSVTAVAGVRGSDVDSQDVESTNTNIKWKDK